VASARVVGLALLAGAWLMGMPVAAGAASILPTPTISVPLSSTSVPLPTISVQLPTLTPSLPPLGSNPIPSTSALPSLGIGPAGASPSTASAQGGGGGGGTRGTAASATAMRDSVISTVIRLLASQVPVVPVLLPLLVALLILLVSAVLAAYRRTQEARRFERLERIKSDFLKLASHELRTPLTVLLGYVSMIRDGDVKPGSPAFKKALSIIEDRLNQTNTIVEHMLEAARLEEGPDGLESEEFDLGEVATDSVLAIRSRVGADHAVEFSGPPGRLVLRSDRRRVVAIVEHMLDNAVKYSPEGGAIECTLVARRQDRAVLTVRDSGLGIAGADLERVFTRFGRLVTRDNSHISGAGLGLYLARESARRMGGDITVTSRPGKGSTFTLSLPLDGETSSGRARAPFRTADNPDGTQNPRK